MHSCPDCGQACYCHGDVEDLDWDDGSEEAMSCTHYPCCELDEEPDETEEVL